MSDTVVLVENLTRVANLKESLQEFLAFCGPITKLTIQYVVHFVRSNSLLAKPKGMKPIMQWSLLVLEELLERRF